PVSTRFPSPTLVPIYELLEVDVADLGAVEAARARGDGIGGLGHGSSQALARRACHSSRDCPQMSVGESSYGAGSLPGPRLREPRRMATRCDARFAGSMQWMTRSQPSASKAWSMAAVAASVA